MKAKLIVAIVFTWAVCHVNEAATINSTDLQTPISINGCNTTKQCWNVSNCDPTVDPNCYFTSINVTSQSVFIELTGKNTGLVALGLSRNQSEIIDEVVFVCGNNNTDNASFVQTAARNGTVLTPLDVTTVYAVKIRVNASSIQCTFNISTILSINSTTNFSLINTTTFFTIINGTTNNTQLENISKLFQFNSSMTLPNTTVNTVNTSTPNTTLTSLSITNVDCGITKKCFPTPTCNPAQNTSCFFSSLKLNSNQTYSIELSGPSSGYIALALTKANQTYAFVCGNNSDNGSFFHQSTINNGTALIPVNNVSVTNLQGLVSTNQSLIQCKFNLNTNFSSSLNASDNTFTVALYNGTVNGTQLGAPKTVVNSTVLDLAFPTSGTTQTTTTAPTTTASAGNSLVNHWTHVLAVLFIATSLHVIISHSP